MCTSSIRTWTLDLSQSAGESFALLTFLADALQNACDDDDRDDDDYVNSCSKHKIRSFGFHSNHPLCSKFDGDIKAYIIFDGGSIERTLNHQREVKLLSFTI